MIGETKRVGDILRRATSEFEKNALSRCAIRQCEQEAPDAFLGEGLLLLLEADDSAGYRFLSVLLVNSSPVFQKLTDRWHFTRDQAVRVAKRLQRVDQNFDTKMTCLLPDRNHSARPFALNGENAERALEILDEISPGRRIIPIMRHLTDHPDSKISSKAALLIGKRLQNILWAKRVIAEATDARLRANAIETMWGVSSPEAIDLFRECLKDWDNRVVGNAIIGLHRAGDARTMELVAGIAMDANPKLRMTAAWAMGEIGDPSFTPVLAPLARDSEAEVRRAALRSLRNFHSVEKQAKDRLAAETVAHEEETPMPLPLASPAPAQTGTGRQFWG